MGDMDRPAGHKNKPSFQEQLAALSGGFKKRLEEGKTMGDYENEEKIKKAKEQEQGK